MSGLRREALSPFLESIATWNPARTGGDALIRYVELGGIDNEEKCVRNYCTIPARSAPSRARQIVKTGDILVSTVRPNLNGVARIPTELDGATVSTGFCVLRPKASLLSPEYLFHWVRSPGFVDQIVKRATGANYPAVSDSVITASEIPLPNVREQQRIATILDQAEMLRQKRQLSLERLCKLPQALYYHMFESERAQAKLVTLSSLVRSDDQINYGVVQPGPEVSEGVPLVRVANVVGDAFDRAALKTISSRVETAYKRSRLQGDEILVACVGSIGAVSLATPALAGANIARAVARVPLDPRKANRVFVAESLKLAHSQRYFRLETRTVAQPTLNIKQLAATPVFCPHLRAQEAFADRVLAIYRLADQYREHLKRLDALLVSLQDWAFVH